MSLILKQNFCFDVNSAVKFHDITELTRRAGDGRGGGLLLRAPNINLRCDPSCRLLCQIRLMKSYFEHRIRIPASNVWISHLKFLWMANLFIHVLSLQLELPSLSHLQSPIEHWEQRRPGSDGGGRQHHTRFGRVAAGRLPRLHRLRRRPLRALPHERVDRQHLAHDHAVEERSCNNDAVPSNRRDPRLSLFYVA